MGERRLVIRLRERSTGAARNYAFHDSPVLIGRSDECDIVVDRPTISSFQAEVAFDRDRMTFTDLSSRNGSLMDGKPLPVDYPVDFDPSNVVLLGGGINLTVVPDQDMTADDPVGVGPDPFRLTDRRASFPADATATLTPELAARLNAEPIPVARTDDVVVHIVTPPAPGEPIGTVGIDAVPRYDTTEVQASLDATASPSPDERNNVPVDIAPYASPPPEELPPGYRLGRFEIVKALGRGGMGWVYQATDPRLGRHVAIKTLARELASDERACKRFVGEAQRASRIESRNVVTIHDFGVKSGIPFFVMELLQGMELASLIEGGPLHLTYAVDRVMEACNGVAAAHAKGILHRDLKPRNIMLAQTDDGPVVKVVDFGISRPLAAPAGPRLTVDGATIGTGYYMSPEQTRGDADIDARADVFSLGVILYECLTGRKPTTGRPREAARKLAEGGYQPSRFHRPEIPATLDAIVVKAMNIRREDRFRSVRELMSALYDHASPEGRGLFTGILSQPPVSLPPGLARDLPPLDEAAGRRLTQGRPPDDHSSSGGAERTDVLPPPRSGGLLPIPPAVREPPPIVGQAGGTELLPQEHEIQAGDTKLLPETMAAQQRAQPRRASLAPAPSPLSRRAPAGWPRAGARRAAGLLAGAVAVAGVVVVAAVLAFGGGKRSLPPPSPASEEARPAPLAPAQATPPAAAQPELAGRPPSPPAAEPALVVQPAATATGPARPARRHRHETRKPPAADHRAVEQTASGNPLLP